MTGEPKPVTKLLQEWRNGDATALDRLLPIVYDELRRLAAQRLRKEHRHHTLAPTALVHEAYLRIAGVDIPWQDRAHFYAMAATLMRRILLDHARERGRQKRGGDAARVPLDEALAMPASLDSRIVLIDEALQKLAGVDARKARIIELVYFGGLTTEEVAEALGLSTSTVNRELKFAKAWILREISPTNENNDRIVL